MASTTASLEIHVKGRWHVAGALSFSAPERGISSPGAFEYDLDYLDTMSTALGVRDARAVSCGYPLAYDTPTEAAWPPFLLDIIPTGAARRYWEDRLQLPNTSSSDWQVLMHGAGNPTGNLRIREAVDSPNPGTHPGFSRADVLERAEHFIEYAHASGAPVSGSSGAGGDSPKFLLREDKKGRWFADGVLPDSKTRHCWLVKFPRTRDASDRLILEAEAAYHAVAKRLGVRTFGDVTWESDCLFIPRFDRVVRKGVIERLGLESLCSLVGIAEFGVPLRKERQVSALMRYVTEPQQELREFLLRDVLDVAMGNTDNHGRNTSVLKTADGFIALSPLYDFAPMILDRRGVARVSRWEDNADYPNWTGVAEAVARFADVGQTKRWLRHLGARIEELPNTMKDVGVPVRVIARCEERIRRVASGLRTVR
ncbi:type II toxin-antitoxin system HipA family toxin [Pendulispora brunnea]|uniref:Type II toxin-antitoxin system HipA family toxin n=1 Tax=Pendulispora brunnea TaxID=2905690 RepID=A0ABZ2KFV8_9BACT